MNRISKPTLFGLLMLVAAITALLPSKWTRFADRVLQPFSWTQWLVSSSARTLRGAAETATTLSVPTLADYEELVAENERLRRRIGHQSQMSAELQERLAEVTGLRGQLRDERAVIRIAAVAGADPEPRREVLTILKGVRDGVAVGDWVAAGLPASVIDPRATGRELLFEQFLIGRVIDAQPFVSRVQLCTDPDFGPQRVWVAREEDDGTWRAHDIPAALRGRGDGVMEIDQSTVNYADQQYRLVLVPLSEARQTSLAVGTIEETETLETRLHFDFVVAPFADLRSLAYVYVISANP